MNCGSDLWYVQLQGHVSDLEHLARYFTLPPLRILKDELGSGFLYASDSFSPCKTPEEVLQHAKAELGVLTGILKLTQDSSEPLRSGAVYRCNASGERDVFVHLEGLQARVEMSEVMATVTDVDGNIITNLSFPPRTLTFARLAVADAFVAKAMRLLAAPDYKSWVGLYRIYEVIEADVGSGQTWKKRGWGSVQDLKRFKHSANSVTVAGDSARHGWKDECPLKNPMTIDEAAAYLNYVLQSWLSSKCS